MNSSLPKKASRRLSLSGLLHSPKWTLVLSFLIAIVLWVTVMSNSNNIQTRTLTVPVTVDLTDTYAEQIGLRLTSDADTEVSVTVRGTWSAVSSLSADDVRVRADVSTVQKAGKQEVSLVLSRNSENVDYDLVSCSPSVITVRCDYWETEAVPVKADVSSLRVDNAASLQLGEAILESAVTDGKLTVSGPQTTIHQIDSLVARVTDDKALSETATFRVPLVALDKDGKEVSLDYCSFAELDGSELSVTVPVEAFKEITFTYEWTHAPKALSDSSKLVSISPKKVKIRGPVDVVSAMEDTWSLGTIDFDSLTNRNYKWDIPLKWADSITTVGGETSVSMSLDLSGYKTKSVSLTLNKKTVTCNHVPDGKTATVKEKKVTVKLCGPSSVLEKITADNLSVALDLTGATASETTEYRGRVSVSGSDKVWVCYGADNSGVPVSVTLK